MKPVPKGRPRFGKGRVYTPQKTLQAEEIIAWTVTAYMLANRIEITKNPVYLTAIFQFKKACRVDIDNLGKLVFDALNGIAYLDDNQIVSCSFAKTVTDAEGIYLMIKEVGHV